MSRNINIDLRKDLKSHDVEDLRYAVDRGLLDPDDQVKVSRWLKKNDKSGGDPAAEEGGDELLALLDGTVPEVNKSVDDDENLTADDIARLVEAEKAGKNRDGVISHLESIEFEGDS